MSLRLILAIVNLRTVCYKVVLNSSKKVRSIMHVNVHLVFGAWLTWIPRVPISWV